jgi:hypothetical protein
MMGDEGEVLHLERVVFHIRGDRSESHVKGERCPMCLIDPDNLAEPNATDRLRDRMGDLDDMLAYEMRSMPHQASADLIPWTERVKVLKMEWDIVRSILGERVR